MSEDGEGFVFLIWLLFAIICSLPALFTLNGLTAILTILGVLMGFGLAFILILVFKEK